MRKQMFKAAYILPFLFLFSIAGPADGATVILQDTSNRGLQVNHFEPIGQSFTAEDPFVSFAFEMFAIDSWQPNDPLQMVLLDGDGLGGAQLGSVTFSIPTNYFDGIFYYDVDLSFVALSVGQIYTVVLSVPGSSAYWGVRLQDGGNPYSGGRAYFRDEGCDPGGCPDTRPDSSDDFSFRVTPRASTTVTANFTIEVEAVIRNSSGLPVAVGDSLGGRIILDTGQAVDSTPAAPYADYAVSGGSFVSIVINGVQFTKPIDLVSVTNDRLIWPPDTLFLDRFFVNAGDISVFGNDGIQFWIDQDQQFLVPTLLSSRDIPVPLNLDLQLSTGDTFIFRSSDYDIVGSFTTFLADDPMTLLQELAGDVAGVGPGKSLADKVKLAQVYYAVPDEQATCAVLTAFVNEVQAQRGKKIAVDLADELTADAQAIMTAIGCD